MSIPTIAISGQLLPPDNVAVGGSVRFRLSGPDVDTGTGVVVPSERIVPLNAGAVAVNLWPTARGENGRSYSVDISLAPASPDAPRGWVGLGQFTLPATPGSRNLGDLLRDFGIVLPMDTALVQALFTARDLAVASAGAAQSAAGAAALSATSAGNSSAAALVMVIAAGAKIFATTAAGIAATPNGGIFMVPLGVSGGLDIRERTGGSNSASRGQILPPVQSQTDDTEGRLATVGWLGMGASRAVYSADLNTATQGGLHSRWDSTTLNVPPFFQGNQGGCFTFPGHLGGREVQFAYENQGSSGLRIAMRQNRGGTWQPWREVYHSARIVGTVSESAGIPTGSVIQRGSNGNGHFVRYADGTQICWRPSIAASDSGTPIWVFPAEFISSSVAVTGLPLSGITASMLTLGTVSNSQAVFRLWNSSGSRIADNASLHAIGRWF